MSSRGRGGLILDDGAHGSCLSRVHPTSNALGVQAVPQCYNYQQRLTQEEQWSTVEVS